MNRYKTFVFLLALNLFVPWESCYSSVGFLPRLFPRLFPKPHIEKALENPRGEGRNIVYSLIGRDHPGLRLEDEVQVIRDFIGRKRNPHLDALPYGRKVDGRILRRENVHGDVKRAMIALSLGVPEAERNASDLAKKISDLLENAKVERIKRQEVRQETIALQEQEMNESIPNLALLNGEYKMTLEDVERILFITPHGVRLEVNGETGEFCLTPLGRCDPAIRGKAVINNSGGEGTLEINLREGENLEEFSAPVDFPLIGIRNYQMDEV